MINKQSNTKQINKNIIEKTEKEKAKLFDELSLECNSRNVNKIKYLLKQGADINSYDSILLRLATLKGDYLLVKLLVENGADIDIFSKTGLSLPIRLKNYSSHIMMLKYLIEQNAPILNKTLEYCMKYQVEAFYVMEKPIEYTDIQYLLECGAKLDNTEFMNSFAYEEVKSWLNKYENAKKLNNVLNNTNKKETNKIKL